MTGLIIKLALFALIVYLLYNSFKKFAKLVKGAAYTNSAPFAKAEECPSCRAKIRVPKEPGACPECSAPLGRSPDGKLLIRVN